MKRLSKLDKMERAGVVDELRRAKAEVDRAFAVYDAAIEAYNSELESAAEWRDNIVANIEEYVEEKSDKWREGENGSAYEEWKSEFENVDLDAIEEPEAPELEHAEQLDAISEQP